MKIKSVFFTVLIIVLFWISTPANAALHNRGGGLIYDDTLNVTWMQNASDPFSSHGAAYSWADSLIHQGYDDWKLPLFHGCNPFDRECNTFYNGQMVSLYRDTGITLSTPGPFINLTNANYATDSPPFDHNDSGDPYFQAFNFDGGYSVEVAHGESFSALALRSGDSVATIVPEPISSTLFIIGGATLGLRRFRKKYK